MLYHVTVGDVTLEVEVEPGEVRVDGDRIEARVPELAGPNVYSISVDGASHTILAKRGRSGLWDLQLQGRGHRVDVADDRTKVMRDMAPVDSDIRGRTRVRAPMPGLVVKVDVEEGQMVQAGSGLLVVEAMKMENSLTAPVGGRVGAINVVAGQIVEKNEILMDLLPPDRESGKEGI